MDSLILESPGAVLCRIGPLTIRWYGVVIAAGFLLASYFAQRMAKARGIESEKITNLFLLCFLCGILGARLYFVALNWRSYLAKPAEILATWLGGLSIHGGIIGGFIAGWLFCHFQKLSKREIADIVGATLPLGQAIGRIGNFFNSEAFGRPIEPGFPIAVRIPPECRPEAYQSSSLFHATFLYEGLWNFAIFALIYFYLSKKLSRIPGICFPIYLALYNIGRLIVEPMRTDSIMAGATPVPIIASWVMLGLSVLALPIMISLAKTKPGATAGTSVLADGTEGSPGQTSQGERS